MCQFVRHLFLIFLLISLTIISAHAEGKQFKIGLINEKADKMIKEYTPLARYVAKRMKRLGITGGRVVVAKNMNEMLKKIENREVDVLLDTAYATLKMSEKGGMSPKLLVWKKGEREYRTLFIVRKDSSISKLSDLRGKTIVFEDPTSTSAFLVPLAELKRMGLTVQPISKKGKTDAVHYRFAGENLDQEFWVTQKKADAAAFSTDDWKKVAEGVRKELKIIHETEPVLRFVASFHPNLPPEESKAISDILQQADRFPEGRKALKKASNAKKIEPLSDKDKESLRQVQEYIKLVEQQ